VVVISVVLFLTRGVGTVGVAPGQRLHNFAAPVATSNLIGDPNFSKPCQLGYFGDRALNTCLLTRRSPLVLAFFVTGSGACVQEVDTLQRVAHQFSSSVVAFGAVAVSASKGSTAALVRQHRWSIPVAYDRDGSVGSVYGVAICPLVELVNRGGVVRYRLIGERWLQAGALAAKVRSLVG
jgi:peroxiredoxin